MKKFKLREDVREKDIKRFFYYVEKTGKCWMWRGAATTVNKKIGYGIFVFRCKATTAHRFSYFLHGGELIKGHHVDHLCRNRLCVNPAHLEMVTRSENLKRAYNYLKRKNIH